MNVTDIVKLTEHKTPWFSSFAAQIRLWDSSLQLVTTTSLYEYRGYIVRALNEDPSPVPKTLHFMSMGMSLVDILIVSTDFVGFN